MSEHFVKARDGTQIFVDDRGLHSTHLTPILCLPGLTRNSKDFAPVFEAYAEQRRVIAIDLRGRGRSSYADPKTYAVAQELDDVLVVLDALNIGRVALIGTSRGGLIGQVMANTHPLRLVGLLLNDIGPEINPVGLKRILNYVSSPSFFKNWDDAVLAIKSPGFSNVSDQHWLTVAKRIFKEQNNHPCTDYDPLLTKFALSIADIDAGKLQSLWAMTPAMGKLPVAVLRGENSDLLSPETVVKMQKLLPDLMVTIVPNRGHVPFLDEVESLATIDQWLKAVDQKEKGRH